MRTPARLLVLLAVLLAAACSGDDDAAPPPEDSSTAPRPSRDEGDTGDGDTGERPAAPDVTVTGPVPGDPQTSGASTLAGTGYVEEEFFVTGRARAFEPEGTLTDDGRWTLTETGDAPFTTRILVKRPAEAENASGVVVVEWNNVSAGFDSTPDWTYSSAELLRAGHVHVGVSAQKGGVDEASGGLASSFGSPLTATDPERYGELSHPGDDYSYDLFGQIGALIRTPPEGEVDPLAGLPRDHVIAAGESQSAFRLTSYVNGVHPIDRVFDGFFVHSRGGGAAPIVSAGDGLTSALQGSVRIRDDLDEPVLVLSTETDLTRLGYASARQPDSERFRSWEIAGTAHADAFLLGGDPAAAASLLGCSAPVNDGPQHLALKAAVANLVEWVTNGDPPPRGGLIDLTDDQDIARDEDGNALGGIRLPPVEVPVATLSGESSEANVLCGLFGSTTPFPPAELTDRYGSRENYLERYERALDQSIEDGFVLDTDRSTALAEAAEVDFG